MKFLSKAAVTGVAVSAAVTGVLVATSGSSQADGSTSYAYGLSLSGGGQEIIPPSPKVESTDGSDQQTGGEIPDNPLITGDALLLKAGNDSASVDVADLTIGGALSQLPQQAKDGLAQLQQACDGVGQAPVDQFPDVVGQVPLPLPPQPTEDDLVNFCDSVFDGDVVNLATVQALNISCQGDQGTVNVVGASLLGGDLPIDGNVAPDTDLFPDNPGLQVTLNRQTRHDDGSFTVDGMVVDLGGGQGELVLGSATCGVPAQEEQGPPTATAPTPVPGNVPVTG